MFYLARFKQVRGFRVKDFWFGVEGLKIKDLLLKGC